MEEDIKILADLIFEIKKLGVDEEKAQAIENLIKRVKELELENIALENTRNMCPHMKTSGISCNYKDSIPKIKIREKIETRQQSIDDIKDNFVINDGMLIEIKRLETEIDFLQELLEDK